MVRPALLSLSFCVLLTASAWAQLASQTALVGTVTDSDGLGVPGAQVTAVNTGTRDTYEATTNAEGYYNIQFVRTGTYEISVTLTGFQTTRVTGIEVANNQVARTNVVVKVGQLNESITVVGSSPILDTDSARISETIGKRAVSDLPLNGRNVWSLASHHTGRRCRPEQRYRPQLQRGGPAGNPEQPVARRHQLLVQPAGRDQHASDRGRGDGDSGPDRQHVSGVRRLPRRPHQRGDQERDQ